MPALRFAINVPDLGIDDQSILVAVWHVREGAQVVEGDQMVELQAPDVAIDLPAPASGVLIERRVEAEQRVQTGQTLGFIAADEEATV